MQRTINRKIKFREDFRPFAPSVLRERADQYFELECDSPYMLLVSKVREDRRLAAGEGVGRFGNGKPNAPRSDIPAEDAYRCFMRTDMDHLVLWPFLLNKGEQPEWKEERNWREAIPLD